MRILSSEVQQIFRAYAKQLRTDYDRKTDEQVRETRAKGFEKVEISDEAKALAASTPEVVQRQSMGDKQGKILSKKVNLSDETEHDEQESETAEDQPDVGRHKRVEK